MADSMNNLTGKEWLQYSFTIWRDIRKNAEETALKHPAMFPVQLCEKLIKIYTKNNGEIILDPFVGVGSTMIAARNLNRSGIGVDLNADYVKIAKERLFQVNLMDNKDTQIQLYAGDSRTVLKKLAPYSVDLCINSPPYWDILNQRRTADGRDSKNYSDSESDIGNIQDYQKFLSQLKEIYSEVFRVMKPNKRCCVVVMDIRKKDQFYPLHMDITKVMEEIGFELEELVIWDRQHEYNNMKTLGYPWVFRFNKVHEYVCIFWKRDHLLKKKSIK
jgi:DNA modification methylase